MRSWAGTLAYAAAAEAAGAPPRERLRVLVVDVPPAAQEPVTHALARPGCAVHWTVAVEDAAARGYDAFVVGQLETASRLLRARPHAAVVLLDASMDPEVEGVATELGVAEYLPVDVADAGAVRRAVRRSLAHARLAESEERLALALRGTNDGLWDWDVHADRLHLSPRWKAMLGHEDEEIGDAPEEWLGRVHPSDRPALAQALEAHVAPAAGAHFEHEYRVRHRDGGYRWALARATAVRDEHGRAIRVVGTQADVNDRKLAELRLQHDALHDGLTGLPNRALFLDRLDQAVRRAQRAGGGAGSAVLFLDLDRFKRVNDTLGHHAGDALLRAVARRLESALRPPDTVARLGGDEFTLLLEDVADAGEASAVAERVLTALARPFELDGRELVVHASVGIALAGADTSPESVLRDADVAMYCAKAEGTGRHAVFHEASAPPPGGGGAALGEG